MNNFTPGGQRGRKEYFGGRPKSDADYGTKKRFGNDHKDFGQRRDDRGPRHDSSSDRKGELFAATCTTCGKSCEVPFRPDGTKPVLCRDCFALRNAGNDSNRERDRFSHSDRHDRKPERSYDTPRTVHTPAVPSPDYTALTHKVSVLESKLDEVLNLLKRTQATLQPVTETATVEPDETSASTKVRATKQTVTKKVVKKATKKSSN